MAKQKAKIVGIKSTSFSKDRQNFDIEFQRDKGKTVTLEFSASALDDLILKLHHVEELAFLHDPESGPMPDEAQKFRFEEIDGVSTSWGHVGSQENFFLGLQVKGFMRWFALPADDVDDLVSVILDQKRKGNESGSH